MPPDDWQQITKPINERQKSPRLIGETLGEVTQHARLETRVDDDRPNYAFAFPKECINELSPWIDIASGKELRM